MIVKKLLEFQKLGIKIERDAQNPHFRSRYSSLNEVLGKVKEPLSTLGILILQRPTGVGVEGAEQGLITELIDTEDDTKVSGFVPFVGATDMQKLGGAISYARRYSLVTLLGLEDEDDDGNSVSAVGDANKRAKLAVLDAQYQRAVQGPVDMNSAPDLENDLTI